MRVSVKKETLGKAKPYLGDSQDPSSKKHSNTQVKQIEPGVSVKEILRTTTQLSVSLKKELNGSCGQGHSSITYSKGPTPIKFK